MYPINSPVTMASTSFNSQISNYFLPICNYLGNTQQKIEKLLQDDIIEESRSPWRAHAFIINNENHKIDYSQTINRNTLVEAYSLLDLEEIGA